MVFLDAQGIGTFSISPEQAAHGNIVDICDEGSRTCMPGELGPIISYDSTTKTVGLPLTDTQMRMAVCSVTKDKNLDCFVFTPQMPEPIIPDRPLPPQYVI